MKNFKLFLEEKLEEQKYNEAEEKLGKKITLEYEEREEFSSDVYKLVDKMFNAIDKDNKFDDADDLLENTGKWIVVVDDADDIISCIVLSENNDEIVAVGCVNDEDGKHSLQVILKKAEDDGIEEDGIKSYVKKFIKNLYANDYDDEEIIYRNSMYSYPRWGFVPLWNTLWTGGFGYGRPPHHHVGRPPHFGGNHQGGNGGFVPQPEGGITTDTSFGGETGGMTSDGGIGGDFGGDAGAIVEEKLNNVKVPNTKNWYFMICSNDCPKFSGSELSQESEARMWLRKRTGKTHSEIVKSMKAFSTGKSLKELNLPSGDYIVVKTVGGVGLSSTKTSSTIYKVYEI